MTSIEETQDQPEVKEKASAGKEETDVSQVESGQKEESKISKSQLKKLKKREKRDQVKAEKRKAEKERYKARKRACIERGETMGPTRKQLSRNKMSQSACKIKVVIDCGFDDLMSEKDISMLVKQIQFSYSANRRAQNPLQFYCCGVDGKTKDRLDTIGDSKHWDVMFSKTGYSTLFDKSSIVYLSSESSNVLETLEEDKVYIIGGLVDHNHHKGLCHRLAEEKGIAHAQLPISNYIDMKTRKVLAINHVFEILLRYTESQDWQNAFYTVLPPRKGAKIKTGDENGGSDKVDDKQGDNDKGDKLAEGDKQADSGDKQMGDKQADDQQENMDKEIESDKQMGNDKQLSDKPEDVDKQAGDRGNADEVDEESKGNKISEENDERNTNKTDTESNQYEFVVESERIDSETVDAESVS